MESVIRFAHLIVLYFLLPLLCVITWYRATRYKGTVYRFPLAGIMRSQGFMSMHPHKKIIFAFRFIILLGLALLIGKPQLIDPTSKTTIEGIDIVLVLDVSGSMSWPHHTDDARSRIDVAKIEASRFVDKRVNDAIGIVLFGNDALSRCPLTADKTILKDVIRDVHIGFINPEGTLLSSAIITAANRLKQSQAKSKIMILLTDGEPSEHDTDPQIAIDIAKKLGIKIYTIGIGDDHEVIANHPFFGPIPMKTTLNKALLTKIADETGGKFFEAKKPNDMRLIYDTIDSLEKSSLQAPQFTHYYDVFLPFIWVLLALVLGEIILRSYVWFSI